MLLMLGKDDLNELGKNVEPKKLGIDDFLPEVQRAIKVSGNAAGIFGGVCMTFEWNPVNDKPDWVELQRRSEYDRDHNSTAPFWKE